MKPNAFLKRIIKEKHFKMTPKITPNLTPKMTPNSTPKKKTPDMMT